MTMPPPRERVIRPNLGVAAQAWPEAGSTGPLTPLRHRHSTDEITTANRYKRMVVRVPTRLLDHPCRLLLGRQAPVWGKLINQVRQMLTKANEQIVHA
jgi:hypothetical protein